MSGIFYGVGVGPGDPELLTVKAIRTIRESDVIAVAVSDADFLTPVYRRDASVSTLDNAASADCEHTYAKQLDKCVAYQIVLRAVPEAEKKAKLLLPMPMKKDKNLLKQMHDQCSDAVEQVLKSGCQVAFITLGDPTVYSTCRYVHKRLHMRGYPTELIPGVPSFCAAAARLNTALAENREELHVIPATYGMEESLKLPGTKVLMKAGKSMPDVKRLVKENGLDAKMVENCGMSNERIYRTVEEIPEDAGYYSLVIVKEKESVKKG